jgi:hypothetical protein
MIELLEHLIKENEEDFEDLLKPASDEDAAVRRNMALDKLIKEYPDADVWPDWFENEVFHDNMSHSAYHFIETFCEWIKERYPNHWEKLLLMPSMREKFSVAVEFALDMSNFPHGVIRDIKDD